MSSFGIFGHPLPGAVYDVLMKLTTAGYPSYLVGGCVRDALLGTPPHDFDVATAATPWEVADTLTDCRIIPTGIKHGTQTVIKDGVHIEVTTFRKEGGYKDHRRPDSVSFTTFPYEDAARRDFTVNAMFYGINGEVLDFFGGQADLQKGIIRAVGAPGLRFEEDALRILRAMRFAAVLGFDIEKETATAMEEKAYLIKSLAVERILVELRGILAGQNADRVLQSFSTVIYNTLGKVAPLPALNAYPLEYRLPVFFALYGGSIDGALKLIKAFKPDRATLQAVEAAATALYGEGSDTTLYLAHIYRKYGTVNGDMVCTLRVGLGLISEKTAEYAQKLKEGTAPLGLNHLAVNGGTLAKNKIATGADLGIIMEKLYDYVHSGGKNEREALLEEAAKIKEGLEK